MTKWITDTSLEELDIDEESIIRAILFDNTHKTLQNNARLLETENLGKITLEQRISLCLDNDLWSWIRETTEEGKFYIDGSIMELFANRLPDLTLKKLGEKMNVKYSQDTYGKRVLICSRAEITKFITGEVHTNLKSLPIKFCKSPSMSWQDIVAHRVLLALYHTHIQTV